MHAITSRTAAGAALTAALLTSGCAGATATAPNPAAQTSPAAQVSPAGKPAPATQIPGVLWYDNADQPRIRMAGTTQTTVHGAGEVSPDGRHVAYVDDSFRLIVANADGSGARALVRGVIDAGYGYDPSWSADGATVLMARGNEEASTAGVTTIATKAFVPLPTAIRSNIHFRFSGDGSRIFYSDGECSVFSAASDGTDIRRVPVLGNMDSTVNPKSLRACDIESVNTDGSRITVDLHRGNQPDGDIAGSDTANSVIDTATGAVVRLPVRGTVRQALFRPDGTLLIRSEMNHQVTLTELASTLEVLAVQAEPAALRAYTLGSWTR